MLVVVVGSATAADKRVMQVAAIKEASFRDMIMVVDRSE